MIHFESFSISKREIIASVAIIALMLVFGFMIHGAINDSLMLQYQEYNKALQINEDAEMFKYALSTDVGNTFAYGTLECVDTVSYPGVKGEYSYIKKVTEKYTRHTRVVSNGKTSYTQVYYSWDEEGSESKHCAKIKFLDVEFDYGQIPFPSVSQLAIIEDPLDDDIRYVYYGAPTKCKGTLYATLKDGKLRDGGFYHNNTIDGVIDSLESGWELVLFWIGWVFLIGILVFIFIYIDNHWLEDRQNKNGSRRMPVNDSYIYEWL